MGSSQAPAFHSPFVLMPALAVADGMAVHHPGLHVV